MQSNALAFVAQVLGYAAALLEVYPYTCMFVAQMFIMLLVLLLIMRCARRPMRGEPVVQVHVGHDSTVQVGRVFQNLKPLSADERGVPAPGTPARQINFSSDESEFATFLDGNAAPVTPDLPPLGLAAGSGDMAASAAVAKAAALPAPQHPVIQSCSLGSTSGCSQTWCA